ncbi:bactofilin family protein [Geothrix campi]|jgi:cytoskeletal protein CcmA (bactofilin family)|uniref:bactofilin family protein n=1 Tax=Geothrix campi TaxID=2966450 RepID=UPI002147DFB3|nr:polymer-forming cytoskeletal protein [Geothrix sp. SG10]
MAVFRNSKSKPDSAPAIHSLLGKDVMLTGEIHTGSQSLRIEGSVEGIIHSTGEISIAPGGVVKGTIYAKHLVVTGRAEGTMKITECLEIHGTGYVEGDVEVGSLVVDEGGTLQGVCVRKDQTRNLDTIGTAKGGTLALSDSGKKSLDSLETKF